MTDRNRTAADELAMALRGHYFMALQKIEPGSVLMSATRDALKRYADEQMARAGVTIADRALRDDEGHPIRCSICVTRLATTTVQLGTRTEPLCDDCADIHRHVRVAKENTKVCADCGLELWADPSLGAHPDELAHRYRMHRATCGSEAVR